MLLEALTVIALFVRAPSFDSTGPGCLSDTTGPPLTDLKEVRIYGRRFSSPDTLDFGAIPARPTGGDSLAFDIDVASGSMGYLWSTAVDLSGNESCIGAQYVFAVPLEDFAPGLEGRYYSDKALGNLVGTRNDPNIDFAWLAASPFPGCPSDSFSVQWLGTLRVSIGGTYGFHVKVNDAARLKVGALMVLDDWATGDGGGTTGHDLYGGAVLQAGTDYNFEADMLEKTGNAVMRLFWTPPGMGESLIPTSAFTH